MAALGYVLEEVSKVQSSPKLPKPEAVQVQK